MTDWYLVDPHLHRIRSKDILCKLCIIHSTCHLNQEPLPKVTPCYPGEALTLEGCMRMCRPQWPPFKAIFSTGDTSFQDLFQLQRPYFYFWNKKCIFKPNLHQFRLNFSWDTNFSKSSFQKRQFQAKKSVTETLLLKTWAVYTYPNFFWVPPSGHATWTLMDNI